ncbi:hypothetical protein Taro_022963 [Colocasia esculenta]|uniref:Uncharacterized protein n=1 Tax=Colocasia esculenta TaxID=4460 RepID=A0A843V2P6_COLES|nr:hypothetical protein [Colocasia esculenta]
MEFWMLRETLVLACLLLSGHASAKECTNTGVSQSHTLRYELSTRKNSTSEAEMLPHHLHLNPTEESTWMGLIPRKVLRDNTKREEFDWAMLYRSMQSTEGDTAVGGDFLKEVSLHDVRLDPDSVQGQAQQTNLEYLLILDVDQLVWSFRKQSGLPTPGKPYGGWEGPEVELRGHFVGHYMSATAKMWASTHNDTLYQKMTLVVDALDACQKKIGTGYLSAFPTELFDRFEALQSVWAPYYTIHKIMAGLVDQYLYAGNSQALQMVVWMADYFGSRVKNVITKYTIERHYASLNEETGGMNDVLYKLYTITGDQKHLVLAHLFDKPCFLGMLAVQADSISGFHANTHIPVVIGAQRRYEITGDQIYKEIGTYFMDIINSSHSYATGGTSVSEFWSDPKRLADTLKTENQESCTTYNMLKVSRNLFRWTKEMGYADYYEKALTNSVLAIQRGTDPGIMIYMLPMGVGVSKARSYHSWGTKFNSFWCCYGTGIESFSKLGDSIYFEQDSSTPSLYIIQYISSSVNWKSGGIILNQKVEPVTSSDPYLQVTLTFSSNKSAAQSSELKLRIPFWTSSKDAKATSNDESMGIPAPGNFLTVTRQWTPSDKLTLRFPITLRTEPIQDDRPQYASVQAILFGPYVLAGLTKGDWGIKAWDTSAMSDWIVAVPSGYNSQLVTLTQDFDSGSLVLSNSNMSIAMEAVPSDGSDAAIHATFRAVLVDPPSNASGASPQGRDIRPESLVMLEPLDLPGMVLADEGPDGGLVVSPEAGPESTFRLLMGVDGKEGTVSLESASRPGCFVQGAEGYSSGKRVRVACREDASIHGGSPAASFTLRRGMRAYHRISFVARGAKRNFLLEPLFSLRDETYTVYFKFGA